MFFTFFVLIACKSVALLINTSKNFFNYRHMSNIQSLQYSLIKAGFPENDVISICREDPFLDSRNTSKDKIIIKSDISIPHVQTNIENLTEQYILNLLYLRHSLLYKLAENDTLLIYMCGHGATEFFKVCDKYFIFTNDLMDAIIYLSTRVKKALIILDTCQASTLIKPEKIPSNVCVVTSSKDNEFSFASTYETSLGVSSIDDFAYSIYNNGLNLEIDIISFFEIISKSMESTVSCWGNSDITLRDILFAPENQLVSKFII